MLLVTTSILHYPKLDDGFSSFLLDVLWGLPGLRLVLHEELQVSGHQYVVEEAMRRQCDEEEVDWLLTVGGTWPAPGALSRQVVPAATRSVLERSLPGLLPWMRSEAWAQDPMGAVLEAGEAGIRGRTLILNLPGNRQLAALYLKTAARVLVPLLQMVQGRDPDEALTFSDQETDQTVDTVDESPGADSHGRPAHRPSLREADFEAFLKRRRS
ncbi:MAG: hypothetical protein OXG36_00075 [Caldilineaceae bacterium]|nr:hypothetical protein [Caldilineaceae bacterium]